ncbi:MAG: hypothetical protein V4608_16100 [Bacteroidota bacterium]
MNTIKSIFLAVVCFAMAYTTVAQTAKAEGLLTKTVYYYQFQGANSLEEVNRLSTDVFALKGVTEFKPVYKPERNFAQIIVVVTEKTMTSENDVLFQITDLKKILEKKGYKNLEFTYEELPSE